VKANSEKSKEQRAKNKDTRRKGKGGFCSNRLSMITFDLIF